MIHSERIVVLYDSITNSVFISQVLVPLASWLSADKERTATIISFENVDTTNHPARASLAREKRITLLIYKRLPFFGLPTLWYAAYRIKNIVKHKPAARVIARGPLAGYACLHAAIKNELIIQIRGLLWHEYEYTQQKHNQHVFLDQPVVCITDDQARQHDNAPAAQHRQQLKATSTPGKLQVAWTTINFTRWLCEIHYKPCPLVGRKFPFSKVIRGRDKKTHPDAPRAKVVTQLRMLPATVYYRAKLWLYKQLEATVYTYTGNSAVTFEAVSPALRTHLIATYNTLKPEMLTLAYDDIPQPIGAQQRKAWRKQTRAELGIPADALVYCYNGSAKPWQCPPDFFTFCKREIAPHANAHLLVLSQDYAAFEKLLPTTGIAAERHHLVSVEHDAIYRYLAAADIGLVFRQASLLNWVSRPTKLLEYQAIGLQIVHNATIAWLAESARNQQRYNAPHVQSGHLMNERLNDQCML